jgi:hypothetical protein
VLGDRWLFVARLRVDSAIFEGLKCKVTATDVRPTSRIAILLVEIYPPMPPILQNIAASNPGLSGLLRFLPLDYPLKLIVAVRWATVWLRISTRLVRSASHSH